MYPSRSYNSVHRHPHAGHSSAYAQQNLCKRGRSGGHTGGYAFKKQRYATIHDLPIELLTMIFSMVQGGNIVYGFQQNYQHNYRHVACLDALMFVCCAWRNIMLAVPKTWNTLWVVAGPLNSPEVWAFCRLLAVTRNTPIKLIMQGHGPPLPHETGNALEKQQTKALVGHIQPHLNRCLELVIAVGYRSSLPSLCSDIGSLRNVELLALRFSNQKHSRYGFPESESRELLHFPRLNRLEIDGPNFLRASRRSPDWLTYGRDGIDVYISGLAEDEAEMANYALDRALWTLRRARTLGLNYVHFSTETGSRPTYVVNFEKLTHLSLYDIGQGPDQGEFLHDFWASVQMNTSVMSISRCYLDSFDSHIYAEKVCLTEVVEPDGHKDECSSDDSEDDIEHSFTPSFPRFLLHHWTGAHLTIKTSPAFNDYALARVYELLAEKRKQCRAGAIGRLQVLEIEECWFSVAMLKKFVYAVQLRRPRSLHLRVRNIIQNVIIMPGNLVRAFPVLPSIEDREWFRANTKSFNWD